MPVCILIDPFACEVRSIDLPKPDVREELAPFYAALSHPTIAVDIFEAVPVLMLRGLDILLVDEEGTFKDCPRLFLHAGWATPLIGKGLIVGADRFGNTTSAETPLRDVERSVAYLERIGGQLRGTSTPWVAS